MFSLLHSRDLTERHWRWYTGGFIAFAALYLLLGLNYPLINVTETRAAEVAREILVTGDWTTLHLNFETYYHKPPLFYWLSAASFSVFGINEFAARLVSALASLGSILLTVSFGTRWFGSRIGLLSGIVLFLSAGFTGLSRFLVCDPLFTFFCTATAFSGYEAILGAMDPAQPSRGRAWMLVCGLACGLGVLTKGPVIVALCGVPFLYAVYFLHRDRSLNWISVAWAIAAGGLVIVPWVVWTASINPDYPAEFLLLHNVQRFSSGFHEEPIWYFLPILIVAAHPWSSMTIPFIYRLWERRDFQHYSTQTFHYLLATGLWCIFFFSLSRCKLPTYILPAAAPLSITMAVYLFELFSRPATTRMERMSLVHSPIMAIIGTIVAVVAYWVIAPVPWSPAYRFWGIAGISIAFVLCLLGLWLVRHRIQDRWWIGSAGFALSLSIWVNQCVLPNVGETNTCLGSMESEIQRQAVNQASTLIAIGKPFYDVMFYAQRQNCLTYKKYDQRQFESDLNRYKTFVLIAPPELDSVLPDAGWQDSALQRPQFKAEKLASHSRYILYRIERNDSSLPVASRE